MNSVVEKMHTLLFFHLLAQSPILSGNMLDHIDVGSIEPDRMEIVIDAKFYDMKRWEKDGVIVYTGDVINGKTAYAEWVNKYGGFATHNKSQGWVNRAILEVATAIANEIGAEVRYEL